MTAPSTDSPSAMRAEVLTAGATVADVLRSFDRLRHRLALDTTGVPGSFAGYDTLQLLDRVSTSSAEQEPTGREIVATAFVVHHQPRSQRVRYCAYERPTDRRAPAGSARLIAEGVGRTVALTPTTDLRAGASSRPRA